MNALKSLFRRLGLRHATPAALSTLPYTSLTLEAWRSAPERVAYVHELLAQPLFRELLGMLARLRLSHRGSLDPTTAAFLLGQRTGAELVLDSIVTAGTASAASPPEVVADYGAANAMEAWEREGNA